MKKILFILMSAMMVLAACGANAEQQEEPQANVDVNKDSEEIEVIADVISEQEHDIVLSDNEDLKITLLNSKHERYENAKAKDKVELNLEIENKKNRTFNILADKLSLDGIETNNMKNFLSESELEPNEKKVITLSTFTEEYADEFELNFKEHLSGRLIYSDYERSRMTIDFSEYINEQ